MDLDNIFTAKEASIMIGREESYFRQLYSKHPERFKSGTIKKIGRELIITREGVNHFTELIVPINRDLIPDVSNITLSYQNDKLNATVDLTGLSKELNVRERKSSRRYIFTILKYKDGFPDIINSHTIHVSSDDPHDSKSVWFKTDIPADLVKETSQDNHYSLLISFTHRADYGLRTLRTNKIKEVIIDFDKISANH